MLIFCKEYFYYSFFRNQVPQTWEKLSSRDRYHEIRKLFRYEWINFISEIISVFYTPFLLLFLLPSKSDDIVSFFYENSSNVDKMGTICCFAEFNNHNVDVINCNIDESSIGKFNNLISPFIFLGTKELNVEVSRKMSKSIMHFKNAYPTWNSQNGNSNTNKIQFS